MKISFAKPDSDLEGALVLTVLEGRLLTATTRTVDSNSGGTVTRAIAASRFEGKKDQTLLILAPAGLAYAKLLLLGVGPAKALDAKVAQGLGGTVVSQLLTSNDATVTVAIDSIDGSALTPADFAANLGFGAKLRAYRFDRYRTKEKPEDKPSLKKLVLSVAEPGAAKKSFAPLAAIAEGVYLTRDLVSEPANVIYPESLAGRAQALTEHGIEVERLGEKHMRNWW